MRVWSSILGIWCLSGGIWSAEIARAAEQDGEVSPSDREGKFFSVFQIVKFKNEACTTDTGEMGTCYTESECSDAGGMASGSCASSFGTCCMFQTSTCGSEINQNNAYIASPSYPAAAPAGMCMFTIKKCDSNVCQYRLDFEDVVLTGPMMGDCTNDTMMVSQVDGVSTAVVPMTLCGTLSGQHMYVTVKNSDPAKIAFNVASAASMSRWKIRVTQIMCDDTDNLAPAGCVTYDMGDNGDIMSYNYDSGNGELINNQKFCHCIKYTDNMCDISLSATGFDLGADDSLTFGNNIQTGTTFGSSGVLNWNFTGPYCALAESGSDGSTSNMGYSIGFLKLPC